MDACLGQPVVGGPQLAAVPLWIRTPSGKTAMVYAKPRGSLDGTPLLAPMLGAPAKATVEALPPRPPVLTEPEPRPEGVPKFPDLRLDHALEQRKEATDQVVSDAATSEVHIEQLLGCCSHQEQQQQQLQQQQQHLMWLLSLQQQYQQHFQQQGILAPQSTTDLQYPDELRSQQQEFHMHHNMQLQMLQQLQLQQQQEPQLAHAKELHQLHLEHSLQLQQYYNQMQKGGSVYGASQPDIASYSMADELHLPQDLGQAREKNYALEELTEALNRAEVNMLSCGRRRHSPGALDDDDSGLPPLRSLSGEEGFESASRGSNFALQAAAAALAKPSGVNSDRSDEFCMQNHCSVAHAMAPRQRATAALADPPFVFETKSPAASSARSRPCGGRGRKDAEEVVVMDRQSRMPVKRAGSFSEGSPVQEPQHGLQAQNSLASLPEFAEELGSRQTSRDEAFEVERLQQWQQHRPPLAPSRALPLEFQDALDWNFGVGFESASDAVRQDLASEPPQQDFTNESDEELLARLEMEEEDGAVQYRVGGRVIATRSHGARLGFEALTGERRGAPPWSAPEVPAKPPPWITPRDAREASPRERPEREVGVNTQRKTSRSRHPQLSSDNLLEQEVKMQKRDMLVRWILADGPGGAANPERRANSAARSRAGSPGVVTTGRGARPQGPDAEAFVGGSVIPTASRSRALPKEGEFAMGGRKVLGSSSVLPSLYNARAEGCRRSMRQGKAPLLPSMSEPLSARCYRERRLHAA